MRAPRDTKCRKCYQAREEVGAKNAGDLTIHEHLCLGKDVFGRIIGAPMWCAMCPNKSTMKLGSLDKHYRTIHNINVRTKDIRALFREQYNQQLPHPDMHNSYGLWLTRRSVLNGNASDREISELWNDFTLDPFKFQGPKLAALQKNFRTSFKELFGGSTPISFHAHLSDIVPTTISSILQILKEYSPTKSEDVILPIQKDNPTFATMYGSYGAAYGPGAYHCAVPFCRSSAAGQPYRILDIATLTNSSLATKLEGLAREGCVAVIVEIVRAHDGRVMTVEEWSNVVLACRTSKVLLIVDECLTLLRCGSGFAHQNPLYATHGKPDLIFFGKGLKVCGIAINWDGPTIEHMQYSTPEQQENFCITTSSYISSPCDPSVLIHAMGIIRLALRENWPERGIKIGDFLRKFALHLYTEGGDEALGQPKLHIGGLGSFIVFHKDCRRLAAVAGFLPSAMGRTRLRWLPTFDGDFKNSEELQQLFLGPLSVSYRPELMRRLVSWWCGMCGESTGDEQPFLCQCGVSLCEICARKDDHRRYCLSVRLQAK